MGEPQGCVPGRDMCLLGPLVTSASLSTPINEDWVNPFNKMSMFLLVIDGEKDQSLWGKENLSSEEQKNFVSPPSASLTGSAQKAEPNTPRLQGVGVLGPQPGTNHRPISSRLSHELSAEPPPFSLACQSNQPFELEVVSFSNPITT